MKKKHTKRDIRRRAKTQPSDLRLTVEQDASRWLCDMPPEFREVGRGEMPHEGP